MYTSNAIQSEIQRRKFEVFFSLYPANSENAQVKDLFTNGQVTQYCPIQENLIGLETKAPGSFFLNLSITEKFKILFVKILKMINKDNEKNSWL